MKNDAHMLEKAPESPARSRGGGTTTAAAATTTPTKTKRLKKKSELAAATPSVKTSAQQKPTQAQKGKVKAMSEPEAKAPPERRAKKKKEAEKGKGKIEKEVSEEEESDANDEMEQQPKQQHGKKRTTFTLPPPLGHAFFKENAKGHVDEGWTVDGNLLWKRVFCFPLTLRFGRKQKQTRVSFFFQPCPFLLFLLFQKKKNRAYGDVSGSMPKTDSIVAVSLNNGPIQTGDAWGREQGHFSKDAEDW